MKRWIGPKFILELQWLIVRRMVGSVDIATLHNALMECPCVELRDVGLPMKRFCIRKELKIESCST